MLQQMQFRPFTDFARDTSRLDGLTFAYTTYFVAISARPRPVCPALRRHQR